MFALYTLFWQQHQCFERRISRRQIRHFVMPKTDAENVYKDIMG